MHMTALFTLMCDEGWVFTEVLPLVGNDEPHQATFDMQIQVTISSDVIPPM